MNERSDLNEDVSPRFHASVINGADDEDLLDS